MDIRAAEAAGIAHVAVSCGYADERSLAEYTSDVAPNAYEAVKIIIAS
jgi:phosphoglycolate phosphatase-like HAD superfamily hydrolase